MWEQAKNNWEWLKIKSYKNVIERIGVNSRLPHGIYRHLIDLCRVYALQLPQLRVLLAELLNCLLRRHALLFHLQNLLR